MQIVEKNIKDIRIIETDYIREDYNQTYLEMTGHAIDCGESIPEPTIDEDGKLIEGRHRVRAAEMKGILKMRFKVVPVAKNKLEDVIRATKGHMNSKLPLLPQDYVYAMTNLLLEGTDRKAIIKAYINDIGLSKGRARAYLLQAQSNVYNRKLGPAFNMLKSGKTIPEIAESLSINRKFLEDKIAEIQINQTKKGKKESQNPFKHFRNLTKKKFNIFRVGIDRDLKILKQKWQTGFATTEEYTNALQDIKNYIDRLYQLLEDKTKRFDKEVKT